MKNTNKIEVRGKECNFCGGPSPKKNSKPVVYRYKKVDGTWDSNVYCRRDCQKAYNTLNGGI